MSSRERILKVLRLEKPDMLPIQVFGTVGYQDGWMKNDSSYQPFINYVLQNCDLNYGWHPDLNNFFSQLNQIDREITGKNGECKINITTPKGVLTTIKRASGSLTWTTKYFLENETDVENFFPYHISH